MFYVKHKKIIILLLVLALVLYLGILFLEEGKSAWKHILNLTFTQWFVILSLSFVNYLLRFWRWNWYVMKLSPHNVHPIRHFIYYLAGFAFTLAPAKVGEGARAIYLKKHGIEMNKSLAAFFAERLQDMIVFMLFASFVTLLFAGYEFVPIVTFVGIVVCMALLHNKRLKSKLESKLEELSKGKQFIAQMWLSSGALMKSKPLLIGFFIGVISWGAEGYAFYLILKYLGIDFSMLMATGVYAMGVLAGALSFMPGGVGGTEAMMSGLLTLSGVPLSIALASVLICRFATLWFAVIIGAIAVLGLQLENNKEYNK